MLTQRIGLLASVPPGSKTQAKARGSSRNLGGPVVSTRISGWSYRMNNSRPLLPRSAAAGAKPERTTWYGQAKATKRGRKDGRASEHSIVSAKPGNLFPGNPVEKRECLFTESSGGNRRSTLRFHHPVTETFWDSFRNGQAPGQPTCEQTSRMP